MTLKMLSEDGTRAITDESLFAIAAYVGAVADGEFAGRHVGVFDNVGDALRWVELGEPQPSPIPRKSGGATSEEALA